MERTFDTVTPNDTTYSQVGTQMGTVSIQDVDLATVASENDEILTCKWKTDAKLC